MIQLKIRTEYSFGETFAPLPKVVERLKALGCLAAGLVDTRGSTWGHVKWAEACGKAGIQPMFGAEIGVAGAPTPTPAPTAFLLAADPSALYRLVSAAHAQAIEGAPFLTTREFLDATGVVKFTGSALAASEEAVEAGVFVSLSPSSMIANRNATSLLRRLSYAKPVIVGDNYFSSVADRKVFELAGGRTKATPQHILTPGEMRAVAPEFAEAAAENAALIAANLNRVELRKAPLIKVEGDVMALCREGQRRRVKAKQIRKWTAEYETRLMREHEMVLEKKFESYFLVVADMVMWAKERMLVGPARGSSAGSLMCYLMGITEVDPIPHGLLFERFVDITRKDLPDIDIDFPDRTRDEVYDYLRGKYGTSQVARIGTVSEYKPKSALNEFAKRLGIPGWETASVRDAMFTRSSGDSRANNCLMDTLNETTPGRELIAKYPAIVLAGEIEGHASHTGQHAAGAIVCNEPIEDFCAVANGIAQLDKIDAEKLNLLKIDVLGLRTLSVIEDSGVKTREQMYNMRFDDPTVFTALNNGRFSGVFQWEGQALQSLTTQIHLGRFEDLVHITALARPGPLNGGAAQRFAERHAGNEEVEVVHPSMHPYLDETYGLVLYQEQVMRIAREIGDLSWEDTSTLRKAMSKSFGKEYFDQFAAKFIAGAAKIPLNKKEALEIWDQINSMGSWSFNKSHAVSYAIISYWTAWLKIHHPLQYAAASLRNAKDDDTAFNMLREICSEGIEYIPFDPERSELNWSVQDGKLVGGFLGLKGIGIATATEMLSARAKDGLTDKHREKLAKCPLIFGELYPCRAQWKDYYERPEAVGLREGTKVLNIAHLPPKGEVVFIGQLKRKDSRDKNEVKLIERRNGKKLKGQTLFLDMRLADDSTLSPFLCRIDPGDYEPMGRLILERGREDLDWFLIRGEKLDGFPMVQVWKVKCLNDPELLNPNRVTEEA